MAERFIKLYKKILNWEWYKVPNTNALFTHLLLTANWKDEKWQGIVIKRGQVVVGRKKLSKDTGLSEQEIRTSLKHLKSTNEITIKSTNKYSLITIVKYEDYQNDKTKTTSKSTNNLTNNQPATNHNSRIYIDKYRNIERENKEREKTTSLSIPVSASPLTPTLAEIVSYGNERNIKSSYCERFFDYYESINWQGVKNWKNKFNYWVSKEKDKNEIYETSGLRRLD